MVWIREWHVTAALADTAERLVRPVCQGVAPHGAYCGGRPHWTLTWSVNESGLPGLGAKCAAFVCGEHLDARMAVVFRESVGSCVAVAPYREV